MKSRHITKTVHINANPDRIFDALTSSEEIIRYFPLHRVTSAWHAGAEILLEGEIDGKPFNDHGRIEVLDRPTHFRYSYWSDNHGTARTPENHLTIDYRLAPDGQGTRLELEHGNLVSEEMAETMNLAWDHLLASLSAHVERERNKHR
jgi:uncharacterized protein YndB with AHSA1/START domain